MYIPVITHYSTQLILVANFDLIDYITLYKRKVDGAKRKIIGKVKTETKGLHLGRVDKLVKKSGIYAKKDWKNGRFNKEICALHGSYYYIT